MDEHARLHVSGGVDVQVAAAAGDTSAYKLAVVLEVERKQRLLLTHFADKVIHVLALLGRGHELGGCIAANRHKVEVPAEECSLADHPVHVLLGSNRIGIGTGPTGGDTKRQVALAQEFHGVLDLCVGTFAAAGVGCVLIALGADGGDKITYANHIVAEGLVDQRGVGKAEKHAVLMFFANSDQVVLADERLAAGIDVDMRTELFALRNDRVDVFEREILLVAVLSGPAARAMQVAGARGIEQDGPRNVALVLFAVLFLLWPSKQVGVDNEGLKQFGSHLGIKAEHTHNQVIPIAAALDDIGECLSLYRKYAIGDQLVHEIHDFVDVFLRVVVEIIDELVERCTLC